MILLKKVFFLAFVLIQLHLFRTHEQDYRFNPSIDIHNDLIPFARLFKSILQDLSGSLTENEFSSVKDYFTKLLIHRNKNLNQRHQ